MRYACPYFRCGYATHDACWREYDREEEATKYGRE